MIQVILVIFVYILGPVLVLSWAVRRYRSGQKPEFAEIVAVALAVVLMGVLIYSNLNFVTDEDSDEVVKIVQELTTRYDFPLQAKYQNRPAVDGIPHRYFFEIRVYGVLDKTQQNEIAEIAKKLRKQIASKPIVLNFFKEEVWQENPDGSRLPKRDQEYLLRKVHLE